MNSRRRRYNLRKTSSRQNHQDSPSHSQISKTQRPKLTRQQRVRPYTKRPIPAKQHPNLVFSRWSASPQSASFLNSKLKKRHTKPDIHFFHNHTFFLDNISLPLIPLIHVLIREYGGNIVNSMSNEPTHVVSNTPIQSDSYISVTPDWIIDCHEKKTYIVFEKDLDDDDSPSQESDEDISGQENITQNGT